MGRLRLFFLLIFFGHDEAPFGAAFSPHYYYYYHHHHHHDQAPTSVVDDHNGSRQLACTRRRCRLLTTALFDKISKKKKLALQKEAMKHTPSLLPRVMEQLRQKDTPSLAEQKLQHYLEALYETDREPTPLPDRSIKLLLHLDQPTSLRVMPLDVKDRIKNYVLNEFLVNYNQDGARVRKLQRDVAFRMDHAGLALLENKQSNKDKKLPMEILVSILGEMERDGQVFVRFGKKGKMVIMRPPQEQLDDHDDEEASRRDDDKDEDDD
jgi:hypothetical protein